MAAAENPTEGAVERAARFIRHTITAGEFVPGQRLVEPELAARIGVSRASLREAFRALEAEGLVRTERYKGVSVRRLDAEELRQSFEIRELLEGLAARRAAASLMHEPGRSELAALMQKMEKAASARDGSAAYTRLNREFHALILDAAGSEQLRALGSHLRPPAIARVLHQRFLAQETVERSLAEHRVIFDALLQGDGARAEVAMRRHIRSSLRSMPKMEG